MKLPALLVSALFVPLIAFATPGGVGSSLQKGLIGHWPLTGESEKVGNELHNDWDMEANVMSSWIFDEKTTGIRAEYTDDKYTGDKSAQLTNSITAPFAFWQQKTGITIGTYFRISVWAKDIDCPTTPYFSAYGASFVSGSSSFTGISTSEWKHFSAVYKATSNSINIYVRTGANASQGSFLIDNLSLKEIKTADTTPYDNHGEIHGATLTTGPSGETDGAMSFDGISDYIRTDINSTDSYTVVMWINPNTLSSSAHYFLEALNSSILRFSVSDNNIAVRYRNPDSSYISYNLDSSPFSSNTWTHIAATYDGETDTLIGYKNGSIGNTNTSVTSLDDFSGPIDIGRNLSNQAYFDGSISDVHIYNRALSEAEIQQLYNQKSTPVVTQKPSLETGLVGHWPMNEASETWATLTGDAWQNSNAYGRVEDTTYFSQTGNTLKVINTSGSWPGAGKMFSASEKGEYKVHIKADILNGKLRPAFHLYKDGSRVSYTAAQVPTTETFTGNHATGFNFGDKSTIGIYEDTDVINLTNAPDFDTIHVAILSESGTASPYLEFQNTNIFVKQLVTADSTPYDNHGKINGATLATGPNGETDGAMTGSIKIPDSNNLDFDNTDFSISTWIKLNELIAISTAVLAKNPSGNAGLSNYALWKYPDSIRFWIGSGVSGEYSGVDTGSLNQDEWYLVTATFNSATKILKIYLNGTLKDQTTTTYEPGANNGILNIGGFDGSLSDTRIYNRALTETEIQQLYEKKGKLIGNKIPSFETGLVGHWPLSGGYTNPSVFADITPYDNHGTSSSTTLSSGPSGRIASATTFDETTYLEIPNDASNNVTNTDDFSLSIWVKKGTNPVDGNVFGIFAKSGKYGIDYTFVEKRIRAGIRNATDGQYQVTYLDPTEMLDWTHITMVYKGETADGLRLYVNGELKNSQTTVGLSDFSSTQNLFIGGAAAVGGSPRSFNGDLFDARFYNRALSADEVKRLYEVR